MKKIDPWRKDPTKKIYAELGEPFEPEVSLRKWKKPEPKKTSAGGEFGGFRNTSPGRFKDKLTTVEYESLPQAETYTKGERTKAITRPRPELDIRDLGMVGRRGPGEDWNRPGRFDYKEGACEKLLEMIFKSRESESIAVSRCLVAVQNKLPNATEVCNEANLAAERRDREEKVYDRKCIPITGKLPPPLPQPTLKDIINRQTPRTSQEEMRKASEYLREQEERRSTTPRVFRRGESMY
jgi:hypothetical protein